MRYKCVENRTRCKELLEIKLRVIITFNYLKQVCKVKGFFGGN